MKYAPIFLSIKNTEHHIERHYEIESNKNYFLQHIYVSDEFYQHRFNHCLSLTESNELKNFLLDEYGSHNAFDNFWYLKKRSFTSFFTENSVDVPICFNKTFSVRKPINEIKLLKWSNYLMRNGQRSKISKIFNIALYKQYIKVTNNDDRVSNTNYSWQTIFLILNFTNKISNSSLLFKLPKEELTNHNHILSPIYKSIESVWEFNKWLFKNMYDLVPMFSFYIYKVDKKIFKNTRGKSGKFTFIWKYVTFYKRLFLVMHWLIKELKLKPGRTLEERLSNLIISLTQTPKSTWVYKVKKFSHNYVYRNSRRTLAENYKTVTK